MGTTTYSQFRENLADVWNDIEDTQEPVIIKRRGHQDMAILPADELESLRETAYLLRSPKNARRLLEAIARAVQGEGEDFNRAALSAELGLDDQKR
jgi:antitoxin YefM